MGLGSCEPMSQKRDMGHPGRTAGLSTSLRFGQDESFWVCFGRDDSFLVSSSRDDANMGTALVPSALHCRFDLAYEHANCGWRQREDRCGDVGAAR